MKVVRVQVTQEDIDKGVDDNGTPSEYGDFCPVERAISRAIGRPVALGFDVFRLADEDKLVHIEIPKVAEDWIHEFGRPSNVKNGKPFDFEVMMP